MNINMASSEVLHIIESDYRGSSKPISFNQRPADAQRLNWWISNGKTEAISQDRKRSALHLYLHIASQTSFDIPENTFPAAFSFSDGTHCRPDKGVIKALERAGALEPCQCEGELCFRLTDAGTNLLS